MHVGTAHVPHISIVNQKTAIWVVYNEIKISVSVVDRIHHPQNIQFLRGSWNAGDPVHRQAFKMYDYVLTDEDLEMEM
jgi:hypothetical protein